MDLLATRGGSVFSVPTMQQGSTSHIHIAGDVLVICTPLDTSWIWLIHDEPMNKQQTQRTNQTNEPTNKSNLDPLWLSETHIHPCCEVLKIGSATTDASGEGLSKASSRCPSRILRIDGLSSSAWGRLVGGPTTHQSHQWNGEGVTTILKRLEEGENVFADMEEVEKWKGEKWHLEKLENVLWWCWGPAFRWKRSPLSTAECVYGVILAVADRQRTTWNCRRLGLVIRDRCWCWRKPLWHLS